MGDSFQKGGYFVQDDVVPGLRVINVNSMFFFKKNDAVKDCDKSGSPGGEQLKWIEQSFKAAKKDNVMVYVMGHVPPNDDDGSALFTSACYNQYYQLLGEYGDIIAGHFTGHTNSKWGIVAGFENRALKFLTFSCMIRWHAYCCCT